jgi:F-type H+-transporting ATPase subunit b
MPQFEVANWPGQIFWLLITFAVVYGLLSRVFIPRMRHGIDARRERIGADMAEARRLRDEAEAQAEVARAQMAQARAEAQRTSTDAKAKAAREAAERQGVLQAELNARLAEAEGRIRGARDQAMGQVRGIAVDTAATLTAKLTGTDVSTADAERAAGPAAA